MHFRQAACRKAKDGAEGKHLALRPCHVVLFMPVLLPQPLPEPLAAALAACPPLAGVLRREAGDRLQVTAISGLSNHVYRLTGKRAALS